jgi:hypothetical protein
MFLHFHRIQCIPVVAKRLATSLGRQLYNVTVIVKDSKKEGTKAYLEELQVPSCNIDLKDVYTEYYIILSREIYYTILDVIAIQDCVTDP